MMWKVWKDLSNKAKYRHLNGFVPIWEMRKELHEKEDIDAMVFDAVFHYLWKDGIIEFEKEVISPDDEMYFVRFVKDIIK